METKNQNGVAVQANGTAKEGANQATKNAANGAAKPANGLDQAKQELANTTPLQNGVETKPQPKEEAKPIKPALNLESTLKLVDDLHRRSIQRINLISRIQQLEVFEVNLSTENDELEENPYQGCRLIIEDDKRRQFVTTTPGLIRLVAKYIYTACHEKLADIEANIVLPS